MDDILSQIIAYAPNKIDTDVKLRSLVQAPLTMAQVPRSEMDNFNTPNLDQGADSILRPGETLEDDFDVTFRRPNAQGGVQQLVSNTVDGSRPGYSGERVYTTDTPSGKRSLGLTKEQNKWFNKTHKNNSNSRFYKKDWSELAGKKSDILDSYDNELLREKPPKGYITTKEFSKKYDFPIYDKKQYGAVTKAESNFINNALMKSLGEKDIAKGRKNLFLQKFLINTLEPKQFETLLDLGDGKRSVRKVNYVKENAALAKKVKTYIDSPSIDPKTIENMNLVLKNKKIKFLFNKGDYKGVVKALGEIKNLTNAERANVMLRVSQAMSGVNFRDFDHGLKPNKLSANKIFKGLETGRAGVPTEYNDAYKALKFNTIKDSIGDEYFTKSYRGFINDARSALKKSGIDVTNLDLNEITGLSSGYKNQTFSSTQFVNFMDNKFNQGAHASMIGEYGNYETALKNALKNGTVSFKGETFTPRQLINNWQEWRGDWFNRLDNKYKTKAVKDILPTFTLGKDPYASAISKKRLAELSGLGLDLQSEGIKSGYAKTFPTIGKSSILKEVKSMESKDIKKLLIKFEARGCKGKAAGGRILFAEGTPDGAITTCAKKGVQGFIDDLKKGNYSKATKDILKSGGAAVKGLTKALNPVDMLKLKNLIGPQALGFMAAFEGGVITDDVIRQGTPLNESLANNWLTKTFLPYTQEYAKAKNLLETGKVPSNMKKYVQDVVTFNESLKDMQGIQGNVDSRLVDDSFGMIDGSSMYSKEKEDKDVNNLIKKMSTISEDVITPGTGKALEMKALQNESEATRMAKKEFSPIFGFDKLKDVRTPGSTSFDYIPEETPKDLRPITYKDYEKKELPSAERQYYENKYNIKPRSSLSEYYLPGAKVNVLDELTSKYNMREAAKYPGFFSADSEKFSEGGITGLRSKYEYKK